MIKRLIQKLKTVLKFGEDNGPGVYMVSGRSPGRFSPGESSLYLYALGRDNAKRLSRDKGIIADRVLYSGSAEEWGLI